MDTNIRKLHQKIKILKELDKNFEIFGSSDHQYKLNPCKTPEELSAFEKKNRIILPEDYRNFLLHIGNGGMGPSYGMLKLEDYFISYADPDCDIPDDFLSDSFPFSSGSPYSECNDENFDNYNKETVGTIILCHHGCGILDILVISGEEKGKIWMDDRRNCNGMSRVSDSFYEWYTKWLDHSISSLETKNKLISKMNESADIFRIININGLGRARGFSVSYSGSEEIKKIYYYEDNEFLEKGAKTTLLKINQKIKAALIIEDNFNIKVIEKNITHKFRQPNKDFSDKNDIQQMRDNAKAEFTGIIVDILRDSLNRKYYYICYVEDIKRNIFIESRKNIDLDTGSKVYVNGILSLFILKKYWNLLQKPIKINRKREPKY